MTIRVICSSAAVAAALSLGSNTLFAAPMRCSGEYNACIAYCSAVPGATAAHCKTVCRDRQKACLLTGCWNDGVRNYCGLLKQ